MDSHWVAIVSSAISAAAAVGISYGVMYTKVRMWEVEKEVHKQLFDSHRTEWLQFMGVGTGNPLFVSAENCASAHRKVKKGFEEITEMLEEQRHATAGLKNFARWTLANKENMALNDINKLINGG